MKNLFFAMGMSVIFFGVVNARDPSAIQKKTGANVYDRLWHVAYKTLLSGGVTFFDKIKNSQITGNMVSHGTSREFEITGEVNAYGPYVVDIDGGYYFGESESTLSRVVGIGKYTPSHKTCVTGCDGTWI